MNLTCVACLSNESERVLSWGEELDVWRCARCGLLYCHPLPSSSELAAFYQGFLYRKPAEHERLQQIEGRRRELCRLFPRLAKGMSFLDHGGGTGSAFAAASMLGLDAHFSEADEQALAFVRDTYGLDEAHVVRDLDAVSGRFDLIFSDNVIEHLRDPERTLRELVAALRPGGTLVLKTPRAARIVPFHNPKIVLAYVRKAAALNGWARTIEASMRKPIWYCDPPRHLYSFTDASFRAMASRMGLSEAQVSIESYAPPAFRNSFTEALWKRPAGVVGVAKRVAVLPLISYEVAAKALDVAGRALGTWDASGLILRVTR